MAAASRSWTVPLEWTRCVWLPDDFGHDSQLPATLVAMDARAVGFARCPNAAVYQPNTTTVQPRPSPGNLLNQPPASNGGCDFYWTAADGSKIFAHWMPWGYNQGQPLYTGSGIGQCIDPNVNCSPTRYVHVPVASDFSVPLGGGTPGKPVTNELLELIARWNKDNTKNPAVLSTFDQYVSWVLAENATLESRSFHGLGNGDSFRSNPYWMGFYGSRMNIKAQHQQATRILLAAETLDAILAALGRPSAQNPQSLLDAWALLVPSTHHDYITGTATDGVVRIEQMPRLQAAIGAGNTVLNAGLQQLVPLLNPRQRSLLVFNPLGCAFSGVVEIARSTAQAIGLQNNQVSATGNQLVYVTAPSAGYTTFPNGLPSPPPPASIETRDGGMTYTLANGLVSATIRKSSDWALTSVIDSATNAQPLTNGNALSFYSDGGNIYEFGFECASNSAVNPQFQLQSPDIQSHVATLLETGPLRVSVAAPITVTWNSQTQDFTLIYTLTAGQPYLEMTLQGQAFAGTSVFATFDLAKPIARIDHGTPAHWDYKTPVTVGAPGFSAFEPTHDFVLARDADGNLQAALYHQAVPGWAILGNTLLGAVLRNTPGDGCDGRGANGSDSVPHSITYALRVPSGLAGAESGMPLQESRQYTTPMYTALALPSSGGALPQFSLASVSAPASAMLMSVKRGTFDPGRIFARVYQPTNVPGQQIVLGVGVNPAGAALMSALEQTPSTAPPAVTTSNSECRWTTSSAITTLMVPRVM
jgi:alpha-mannosidase